MLELRPSSCTPQRDNQGTIRLPLTAPIHLRKEDIVLCIPYEDGSVLEARDVSPVLKPMVDEIADLGLPRLLFASRPYALTFEVDQTECAYTSSELDGTIDQIEETVQRYLPPVKPHEEVHSVVSTWHKD